VITVAGCVRSAYPVREFSWHDEFIRNRASLASASFLMPMSMVQSCCVVAHVRACGVWFDQFPDSLNGYRAAGNQPRRVIDEPVVEVNNMLRCPLRPWTPLPEGDDLSLELGLGHRARFHAVFASPDDSGVRDRSGNVMRSPSRHGSRARLSSHFCDRSHSPKRSSHESTG
jgi:hypothetical protein